MGKSEEEIEKEEVVRVYGEKQEGRASKRKPEFKIEEEQSGETTTSKPREIEDEGETE